MAFEVMDEHEQGELVQKWLRENAMSIVIGVGLGLLLIFGWQQWKNHRAMHQLEASTQYMGLTDALEKKNYELVNLTAQKLRDDYGNTSYAALAAMQQADAALTRSDKPDPEAAFGNMQWAYAHAPAELKDLFGTRLARLQIANGKFQDALTLLDGLSKSAYPALIGELRGDAELGLGHKDQARTAYGEALNGVDTGAPHRKVVEMKLANVSSTTEKQG